MEGRCRWRRGGGCECRASGRGVARNAPTPQIHSFEGLRLHAGRQAGAYFITVCTQNRACLFGEIAAEEMQLNRLGRIVAEEWLRTAKIRPGVELDEWVVMPNHFHGIVVLSPNDVGNATGRRGVARNASTHDIRMRMSEISPKSGSLPTIVRAFKSAVTHRINAMRGTHGAPVWQRNYYEHIIRNDESLDRIREYIAANPSQWAFDRENPWAVPAPGFTPDRDIP